jgi:hypothetical protein
MSDAEQIAEANARREQAESALADLRTNFTNNLTPVLMA